MWVGLDDTDSREGGCTTYVGFLLSHEAGEFLVQFPRLVRLNPNISYKTRGNGAISIQFSRKGSSPFRIGKFDGKWIMSNARNEGEDSFIDELRAPAENIIEKHYAKDQENTNPALVFCMERPPESLYRNALQREIDLEESMEYARYHSSFLRTWGIGRGIIGSLASIAWRPGRRTYELISYSYPHGDRVSDRDKQIIGEICESREETFNSMDSQKHIALFPRERTPVIYGIRSTSYEVLLDIQSRIAEIYPEYDMNFIIYETNQGTDDHIIHDPVSMEESGSYSVQGTVVGMPSRGVGGHLSIPFSTTGVNTNLMAFEPSKEFRNVLENLRPGDILRAYGSMGKGNIKLEKIDLMGVSEIYRRIPPICGVCGGKTMNLGRNVYECMECSHRSNPTYSREERNIHMGKYEPPVNARRHLSMPWKLEGYF